MKGCEETFNGRDDKELTSVLYSDLIAAGYLEGATSRDENGTPNRNRITNITLKGRMYLDEIQELEKSQSRFGKIKKYGGAFGLWILGIATPLIVDVIKAIFKK